MKNFEQWRRFQKTLLKEATKRPLLQWLKEAIYKTPETHLILDEEEELDEDKLLSKDSPSKKECAENDNEDHRCYKYTKNAPQHRPDRGGKRSIRIKIR